MGLEKMEMTPRTSELKKENPDLKLVSAQLDEAIKQEDFEQAAILRDYLQEHASQGDAYELNKKDFIEPTRGGVYIFLKNNPRHRAWKGIEEKQERYFYEDKEKVDKSRFAGDLTFLPRTYGVLEEDDWQKIRNLKETRGGDKVDMMISLQDKIAEAKSLVDLAEEKFQRLWQPYCKKHGLAGQEFEEMHSLYNEAAGWTEEKNSFLNQIPRSLGDPLRYWQNVYDNSRFIRDELEKALAELQ
ncbi:MAG: UvrB/UvrC motif-containing protein [Candidatus Falkowbacteria bacterium]|nr:MAG: UvrB/UvrC motif-containing protein [Candidatus Falkowbacteria bacterium]